MSKRRCSITRELKIVPAGAEAYRKLARFHYRDGKLGPYAAIYALEDSHPLRSRLLDVIGVIVYSMPSPGLELRNEATNNYFTGLGNRAKQLQIINRNIRCIRRVIIEPRYRGLGLASRLVRETMPLLDVPVIESLAVMGVVNPFFEKAGMKAYPAKTPARCTQMTEALSYLGIEGLILLDAERVEEKLKTLSRSQAEFFEGQVKQFLQSYGKRRLMPPGLERTRFILSKLNSRPVYYIWFNPEMTVNTFSGCAARTGCVKRLSKRNRETIDETSRATDKRKTISGIN
jgi:GNAT superfamily N-acetyltransferase